MKKMKEYKRDVEFDLLGRQGSSAGATNTAAASGGVLAWIWGAGATVAGNTVAAPRLRLVRLRPTLRLLLPVRRTVLPLPLR
jgi:hypothetical protein